MNESPKAIDLHSCEVAGVSSRADHSVRVAIVTAELRPSESGILMAMHGKAVRVLIAPHNDNTPPLAVETERAVKSPGQRLRAVLFVLYRSTRTDKPFEEFYAGYIETFINQVKDTLPPE